MPSSDGLLIEISATIQRFLSHAGWGEHRERQKKGVGFFLTRKRFALQAAHAM